MKGRRPIWLWAMLGLWLAALAGLGGWLLLRGGNEGTGNELATANQIAPPPMPRARALPPAEQLDLAFHSAFGASRQARRTVGDQTYVYRPDRLEWAGERAILISLGRNVEDCHACGGSMAIHYLLPEGDGLRVTGSWLEAGPSGDWGNPPAEVAVNRELADSPVVYSTSTGGGQGYTCTVAWLVELRPEGPVTSGPIAIAYSNAGAVMDETGRTFGGDPMREIEGRIANVRRGEGFDVAFTGAERFSDTYIYRDGRFVGPGLESRAAC